MLLFASVWTHRTGRLALCVAPRPRPGLNPCTEAEGHFEPCACGWYLALLAYLNADGIFNSDYPHDERAVYSRGDEALIPLEVLIRHLGEHQRRRAEAVAAGPPRAPGSHFVTRLPSPPPRFFAGTFPEYMDELIASALTKAESAAPAPTLQRRAALCLRPLMDRETAHAIRAARVGEGFTWRAISGRFAGFEDQATGRDLCAEAAQVLGEDGDRLPWNEPGPGGAIC